MRWGAQAPNGGAAGWALSMAVIYLPYAYENGLRSDMSEKMITRLSEEFA